MVGPSISADDRKRFLVQLKIGFALLVGGSMGLVTLWGGGGLLVAAGAVLGATVVGGVLAHYTFPDSIADTPYVDDRDRGPKPGARTRRRRNADGETRERATDGEGPPR